MADGVDNRSNAQWLADLRRPGSEAASELRGYLRRGLAKALSGRADAQDLDDFAQDALVAILRSLDSFRGDSRFVTWTMAVAVRTAFSALRRRRCRDRSLDELRLDTGPAGEPQDGGDPAIAAEHSDLLDALNRAIRDRLTPRQRIAILGELSGLPGVVLADRLEINLNAFYKLHHDARKKLRRALSEAGFTAADVRAQLARTTEEV